MMYCPPSYQLPPDASLNTTTTLLDAAPDQGLVLKTSTLANSNMPINQKTISSPTANRPTSLKYQSATVTKFTDALANLRMSYALEATESIGAQKELNTSILSTLFSTHHLRQEDLTTVNTEYLDADLAETTLEFKDSAGQDKGSATLGQRMQFFETKVGEIRTLIQEATAERISVAVEIVSMVDELRLLLDDGAVERIHKKAEEWKADVAKVFDDAGKAWDALEEKYQQEKATQREGLLKLCGAVEI